MSKTFQTIQDFLQEMKMSGTNVRVITLAKSDFAKLQKEVDGLYLYGFRKNVTEKGEYYNYNGCKIVSE